MATKLILSEEKARQLGISDQQIQALLQIDISSAVDGDFGDEGHELPGL